jgi:hypothetical protein
MTNLMTHQKVIDSLTRTVPVREGQYAGLNVELSRLTVFMFYYQVFLCKETSQLVFDFKLDGHGVSSVCT